MRSSNASAPDNELGSYRAWGMFALVFLASVMCPLAQFKVSSVSSWLMAGYGFDISNFGLLMSCISVVGIILAFPAAFFTGSWGPKKAILFSLCFIIVGTAVGAVASGFEILLVSRLIEGCGLGLMGICAPTAVTAWFPADKRGLPLGIWSAWVPVGVVVALNVSPRIAGMFGFRAVWWCFLFATVVVFVLFALFYRLPSGVSSNAFRVEGTVREGLHLCISKDIWVLGIMFFSFHIVGTVILNTYYPTFLSESYGMEMAEASSITSIHTFLCIFTNPFGGWLYDRFHKPKQTIAIALCILIACVLFAWWAQDIILNYVFVIVTALGVGMIAGCCRATGVEILSAKNPRLAVPMSQAVLTFCQRAADCFVPIVFGMILAGNAWNATNYFTLPVLAVALLLVLFALRLPTGTIHKVRED